MWVKFTGTSEVLIIDMDKSEFLNITQHKIIKGVEVVAHMKNGKEYTIHLPKLTIEAATKNMEKMNAHVGGRALAKMVRTQGDGNTALLALDAILVIHFNKKSESTLFHCYHAIHTDFFDHDEYDAYVKYICETLGSVYSFD